MKKIVIVLCLLIPVFVNAQINGGIKFSSAKSWSEVLVEAKKENKPILIDAYATWCGPCKMMDAEVYTDAKVAKYVNENFITIKVQMDSTKDDNDYVKGWYPDVFKLKRLVDAFPTFLFYSMDGLYTGKEVGYHPPADFLVLLKKAIDPKESYLAQLKAFNEGQLDKNQLLNLAYRAKEYKEDTTAFKIARVYKRKYVNNLPVDSLLNPTSDRFAATFIDLFSFKDKIIQYIYNNQAVTDIKFGRWPQYSRNLTDYVINRDYIYNVIKSESSTVTTAPKWEKVESNIANSFSKALAKRLILDAKIGWFYRQKDWDQAVKMEFKKIENYGMDTTDMGRLTINNLVYEIVFRYIQDKSLLRHAAGLMKKVVNLDANSSHARLDTYASILYKAGYKTQAIEVESKALNIAAKQNDTSNLKFYREVISKMRNNQLIWK